MSELTTCPCCGVDIVGEQQRKNLESRQLPDDVVEILRFYAGKSEGQKARNLMSKYIGTHYDNQPK